MEKKINIDGIENKRYSIKAKWHKDNYVIFTSIQIKRDVIWQDVYVTCFILSDKETLEESNFLQKELDTMLEFYNVNNHFYYKIDEFSVPDMLQLVEDEYNKIVELKKYRDTILKPYVDEIENTIKSIDTIGFEEVDVEED